MIKNKSILRWLLLLPFVLIVFLVEQLGKLLKPRIGEVKKVKVHYNTTKGNGTVFCTPKTLGTQYCTYYIQDRKYFRYSFAKNLFNIVIVNVRLGSKQNKNIFKIILKWL